MIDKDVYIKAARDFTFHGMTFGDSPSDIEDIFEDWFYNEDVSDPKAELDIYAVPASGLDIAILYFFRDQLFLIKMIYEKDRLVNMGDWTAIYDRLISKFGNPEVNSTGVHEVDENGRFVHYNWSFENVDREIELEVFIGRAIVYFRDSNLTLAAYNHKKRQADIGF